jgi:hypothetical protein
MQTNDVVQGKCWSCLRLAALDRVLNVDLEADPLTVWRCGTIAPTTVSLGTGMGEILFLGTWNARLALLCTQAQGLHSYFQGGVFTSVAQANDNENGGRD